MAGFDTVKMYNVVRKVMNEENMYELLQKAQSKTSEAQVLKREKKFEHIKKLFDVAVPDLEKKLEKADF